MSLVCKNKDCYNKGKEFEIPLGPEVYCGGQCGSLLRSKEENFTGPDDSVVTYTPTIEDRIRQVLKEEGLIADDS